MTTRQVLRRSGHWVVMTPARKRVVSQHDTRDDALSRAKDIVARAGGGTVEVWSTSDNKDESIPVGRGAKTSVNGNDPQAAQDQRQGPAGRGQRSLAWRNLRREAGWLYGIILALAALGTPTFVWTVLARVGVEQAGVDDLEGLVSVFMLTAPLTCSIAILTALSIRRRWSRGANPFQLVAIPGATLAITTFIAISMGYQACRANTCVDDTAAMLRAGKIVDDNLVANALDALGPQPISYVVTGFILLSQFLHVLGPETFLSALIMGLFLGRWMVIYTADLLGWRSLWVFGKNWKAVRLKLTQP